jgi:hypothetical protein
VEASFDIKKVQMEPNSTLYKALMYELYTVKKASGFPVSSRVTGIIKLFPSRESLVIDIPAGDGKTANLFLQCTYTSNELNLPRKSLKNGKVQRRE